MAAGLGFKTFNSGDVLTAADTNGYLMQGVLVFADAAARTAAITSPQEGQTSYLKDTDEIQVYSGAAWITKSGALPSQSGNSGKFLTTDGTSPSWGVVSGGGMTLLSTTTLSGATTTISSIDQTYVNLQVIFSGITITTAGNGITVYFNATQNQTLGIGQRGVDLTNSVQSTVNNIPVPLNSDLGTDTDNCFVLNLYNYNSTTRPKPFQMAGFAQNNSNQSVFGHLEGAIRTNSAISSITFNSASGTSFTAGTVLIYGVK